MSASEFQTVQVKKAHIQSSENDKILISESKQRTGLNKSIFQIPTNINLKNK